MLSYLAQGGRGIASLYQWGAMPTQKAIDNLKERLNIHRYKLEIYLKQQARFGKSNVPPNILLDIDEARTEIQQIKSALQQWNVPVDDHPNDEPFVQSQTQSSTSTTLSDAFLQNLLDPSTNPDDVPDEFAIVICEVSRDRLFVTGCGGLFVLLVSISCIALSITGLFFKKTASSPQETTTLVVLLIMGVITIIGALIAYWWVYISRKDRIRLLGDGIERVLYGKRVYVSWKNLADVRPTFQVIQQGQQKEPHLRSLRLIPNNQNDITLTRRYEHIDRLERLLYRELTTHHLPDLRAEFNQKGKLKFGKLLLTLQGIKKENNFYPWGSIRSIDIHNHRSIIIHTLGQKDPKVIGSVEYTPRHFLLIAFVKEKIGI